jgi:hypothetical protein
MLRLTRRRNKSVNTIHKSILTLSLLCISPQLHAREMGGRFGIGLEQSLGGASGIGIRYFASPGFAVAATLGLDLAVVDGDISAGVAASLGGAFQLARSEHAHLSIGARLALGYRGLESFRVIDPTATESNAHFALEFPLGLEVWLSDHLSIGAATGILVNLIPDGGAQLRGDGPGTSAPPGSIGIGLGAGSISGTLSMLYYF